MLEVHHPRVTFTPLHRGRLKCNLCEDVIKGKMGKSHRKSCPRLPQKNAVNQAQPENKREEKPFLVMIIRYNTYEVSYSAVEYICPLCGRQKLRLTRYGGYEKVTCPFCDKKFVINVKAKTKYRFS